MSRYSLTLMAALTAMAVAASPAQAVVTYNTIARTGVASTEGPNWNNLGSAPGINSNGILGRQYIFQGTFQVGTGGATSANDSVIMKDFNGIAPAAREGQGAAGTSPVSTFDSFIGPILSPDDSNAFFAFAKNGQSGIWTQKFGQPVALGVSGSAAPGTLSGVTFAGFADPSHNGGTVFYGNLQGTGVTSTNDEGLWTNASGTVALVQREGDAAPGIASAVFANPNSNPAINNSGRVAFHSFLQQGPGGVTSANDSSIWIHDAGVTSLAYREGNAAPGTGGASLGNLGQPRINAAGNLAFFAGLQGTGVTTSNDTALFADSPGALTLVAREGSAAPGTTGVFNSFSNAVINSAGRVAFQGTLVQGTGGVTAANESGIWAGAVGSLSLVAREGDQAPGTPAGALFETFGSSSNLPTMNAGGHVAFVANLKTGAGGVVGANSQGLWAQDQVGQLTKIVRLGDSYEVSSGVFKTINQITFGTTSRPSGGQDGYLMNFNDNYVLIWSMGFTDGTTGIFTAVLAVVPEAHQWLMLVAVGAVSLTTVAVRRRRPPAA